MFSKTRFVYGGLVSRGLERARRLHQVARQVGFEQINNLLMVSTLLTTTELARFHFGNLSCKTLLLSCHITYINYLCKLVSTICK
jgi:hypothetical protein